jgi:hypothetical protein
VHGFNAAAGRQTLGYTARGELVYPAGCLGVVLDLNLGRQRYARGGGVGARESKALALLSFAARRLPAVTKPHFRSPCLAPGLRYLNGHTDLVTCLRVWVGSPPASSHADQADGHARCLVASGETGRVPKVLVWSPGSAEEQPQLLACLKGFHRGGVAHVAWSPDGERVATGNAPSLDQWHTSLRVALSALAPPRLADSSLVRARVASGERGEALRGGVRVAGPVAALHGHRRRPPHPRRVLGQRPQVRDVRRRARVLLDPGATLGHVSCWTQVPH